MCQSQTSKYVYTYNCSEFVLIAKGGVDTEMKPGSLSRFTKLSSLGTFKVSGCQ